MGSAIAGDVRRAVGILNNEAYVGRVVWNRVRWVRSAADSSKRRCIPNPPSEWLVRQDESLRVVPQELWDRVKARQQGRAEVIGERVKKGLRRESARRVGGEPKYLFSGLLICGECGARFVVAGANHYACSSRLNGGKANCANGVYLKKSDIEPGLIAGIKRQLSDPEVIAELQRRVRQRIRSGGSQSDNGPQIAKLEREAAALVDAIASGALKTSPAIAERLQQTEVALARLKSQPAPRDPEKLLPELAIRSRALVENLERRAWKDPRRARQEIAERVGPIRVNKTSGEIRLEAQKGHMEQMLLAATGTGGRQMVMVAGV